MKKYILLLTLIAACADTPLEPAAAPVSAGSPLAATAPGEAPPGVLADAGAVPALMDAGEPSPHELWFGDSGWDCCWTAICGVLSERCADDEVMTTNGLGTVCCSPSIGQCPEEARPPYDSDAGR